MNEYWINYDKIRILCELFGKNYKYFTIDRGKPSDFPILTKEYNYLISGTRIEKCVTLPILVLHKEHFFREGEYISFIIGKGV